ncbi:MAG: PIG-L family deacetylase [Anaerolineae bacterium]|nr:PIG-L family deacetylase [Anaerolineae bacterium]
MRLLCIVAHPDDETLFAGGIMHMLARQGVELHILCATRGEGGESGDPPPITGEQLGHVREEEMRCAAHALGAASLQFMGYIDPAVGENDTLYPYTDHFDELVAQIGRAIEAVQPTLLLTHGSQGEYGHPAHVLTHRAVLKAHTALRETGGAPHLYTFGAAVPGLQDRIFNTDDPAHIVADVRPWLEAKAAAAACHRTQYNLFFRNHPTAQSVRDIVRTVESLHRVWPPAGPHLEPLVPYRLDEARTDVVDAQREEWTRGL